MIKYKPLVHALLRRDKIEIRILNKSKYPLPAYKTKGASRVDLHASLSEAICLRSLDRALIPIGLHVKIPQGREAQVRARSGLALEEGLSLLNGIGIIDLDYRGELEVTVVNLGRDDLIIEDGDRIAQMVIMKIEQADFIEVRELSDSGRGEGGFGHTGV